MNREQIVTMPIEEVATAPQVRQQTDPESDKGLAVSIRECGLPAGHTKCRVWTIGPHQHRLGTVRQPIRRGPIPAFPAQKTRRMIPVSNATNVRSATCLGPDRFMLSRVRP
jgi:hypothetical protein